MQKISGRCSSHYNITCNDVKHNTAPTVKAIDVGSFHIASATTLKSANRLHIYEVYMTIIIA